MNPVHSPDCFADRQKDQDTGIGSRDTGRETGGETGDTEPSPVSPPAASIPFSHMVSREPISYNCPGKTGLDTIIHVGKFADIGSTALMEMLLPNKLYKEKRDG